MNRVFVMCVVLCSILTATSSSSESFAASVSTAAVVSPDKPDGVYGTGDSVRWTVRWQNPTTAPADAKYILKSGGLKEVASGDLKFTENVARFDSHFSEPNTMLAVVTWGNDQKINHVTGGAVADPFQIKPAADEPADFESFWQSKLDQLKRCPPNAKLTPAQSGKAGVTYAKVTLDNVDGAHVQGQIARPASGEKFPAVLIPQWAGVYALEKSWVTDRAASGWPALNIEAHDIPIDNPPKYYTDLYGLGGALQNYWKIGNEDRETSYYVHMYFGACQAIEYLKTRPDWNGKTLVVMGASQGGQQTLVVAGLYPQTITAALPILPAACDNLGPSIGRAAGFPNWWTQTDHRNAEKVHETSKYFDPVYFARRTKCPVLIGFGLRDEVAPPSSVLAAVNQITSPKEVIILPTAGHEDEHGSQSRYNDRAYRAWLPVLAKGEPPPAKSE